jgi:beta-lactamase regulating signal transducer with metallopeptidase domain
LSISTSSALADLATLATGWWSWIAPLAVQAAICVALVLLLDRALARRGWPQLRHALWLLAALRFVLPPTLSSPISLGAWLAPAPAPAAAAGQPAAADHRLLLATWLVGVVVALAVALRGWQAARAVVRGEPAPPWMQSLAARTAHRLRLRRVPRVVLAPHVSSACVRGLVHPVVALPASTERADVEALLVHELAHVRRGDLWLDAALTLLRAVFWFHPGAWLVKARVARVRELCCDATAAAALGPRAGEYRATLLRAAARMLGEPNPAPQPAFAGASSQIVARLRALEAGPPRRPALRSASIALVALVLAACVLPLARPSAAAPAADDASLQAARALIASAMDGTSRPGCLRLHLAATRIAVDEHLIP